MDLVISRYQQLIKENLKEVAKLITTEQGKTLADAEGDVMRGLQETKNIRIYLSFLSSSNISGSSGSLLITEDDQ